MHPSGCSQPDGSSSARVRTTPRRVVRFPAVAASRSARKGTGRARQGTTRAAQFRHGGVVFGPHPRSYAFRVNNKVVKLAMASVLSGKLAADELFVVDGFNFDKPSTKAAAKALEALGCKGRVTVVVNDEDVNSFLSFRNLEKVRVIGASESNTYDLLDNGSLVMTKDAVEYVQEVLS